MPRLSPVAPAVLTTATALSLALTGAARAQTAAVLVSLTITPSTVPAGPATAVNVSNPCANGTKPTSVTGFPAPNETTTDLHAITAPAPKPIRIAGVWPPTPPLAYVIAVTCPSGTKETGTVTVESAPAPNDVVGVGSDTIENVFDQFSADYNTSPPNGSTGSLYSWDATDPVTGAAGAVITTKQGCNPIARPDGSSAGILALTSVNGITGGHPCMDFARSSRPQGPGDPSTITFVTLAGDAVSYATQSGSNAPADLTTNQLFDIYDCRVTNWSQVGGKPGTIAAMLPQAGSGTRSFFLSAISLAAPGPCVSTSATRQGPAGANDNTLQENEGVAPSLNTNTANVIVPLSVGKYLAERYHSASCGTVSQCFGGPACTPTASQNLFGCNIHGTMNLNMINGANPTVPFPLTSKTTNAVINSRFSAAFQRFVYEVVSSPNPSIPAYLQPYFSDAGWVCTSPAAQADLKNYGFLVLPPGPLAGQCGHI